MNEAVLMIAVTEAKEAAKVEASLEGKLRAAMNATKNHWMATDQDTQFKAAIGAVLLLIDGEEKSRLEEELLALKNVNAMFSGVSVNIDAIKVPENPIGVMKMWQEIKGIA